MTPVVTFLDMFKVFGYGFGAGIIFSIIAMHLIIRSLERRERKKPKCQ